jgi:hypothetical protein
MYIPPYHTQKSRILKEVVIFYSNILTTVERRHKKDRDREEGRNHLPIHLLGSLNRLPRLHYEQRVEHIPVLLLHRRGATVFVAGCHAFDKLILPMEEVWE